MAFLASSSLTFVFENNFDKCSQSIPDKSIELVLISNQHLYGDKIGIYVRHCNYVTVSRTLNTKNWCHLLRNGTESIFFHRALFPFNSPFNFKSVPKWVACLRFVADISWSSKSIFVTSISYIPHYKKSEHINSDQRHKNSTFFKNTDQL